MIMNVARNTGIYNEAPLVTKTAPVLVICLSHLRLPK
jgi:hypothetical protein